MAALRIQPPTTDFETWTAAFSRFREARRNAGVRAVRAQRPVDAERYVVVDRPLDAHRSYAGIAPCFAEPVESGGPCLEIRDRVLNQQCRHFSVLLGRRGVDTRYGVGSSFAIPGWWDLSRCLKVRM